MLNLDERVICLNMFQQFMKERNQCGICNDNFGQKGTLKNMLQQSMKKK